MILAMSLAVLIGLSLGLLGGGGSILTVPILVYALGVEEKSAIASSLLIVGTTSAVAAAQHAIQGNVRWRIGLIFAAAGMAGAFAGGWVARFIPGAWLIAAFAVVMLATGVAMWRKGSRQPSTGETANAQRTELPLPKIMGEGLVVGVATGLVGAGGGFLVVPALALLGGLPMHQAIGTSLVVIALKSFAGFAGYLSHVAIDYGLAIGMSAAAVGGSLVGTRIGRRWSAQKLQRSFAMFVIGMAGYLLVQQSGVNVPTDWLRSDWPFWLGGLAIGVFVLAFLYLGGRLLGVSTGFMDACQAVTDPAARRSWRLPFLAGIIGGGALSAIVAGGIEPTLAMGMIDGLVSNTGLKAILFTLGGVLIGFGARLAGGCTSGHGIVGIALLAPSSIISMSAFMVAGVVVANVLFRLLGGLL